MTAQYALYDALVSISVPADKALGRGGIAGTGHEHHPGDKSDLSATQLLLKQEIVRDAIGTQLRELRIAQPRRLAAAGDRCGTGFAQREIDANRVLRGCTSSSCCAPR